MYRNEAEPTDPNNRHNLVHDPIQAATGIDDRHMSPETDTAAGGAAFPSIGFTLLVVRTAWPTGLAEPRLEVG